MTIIIPDHARAVLASHNEHKLHELRTILTPLVEGLAPEELISARGLGIEEPVEDGITFTHNALIKARAVCQATGLVTVADDSGLCVDVMGGAPGIFSARWSGKHGQDKENLELLLNQLHDIDDIHRSAQFVCAAVVVTPQGDEQSVLGYMPGRIAHRPCGSGGFGYDPIFIPDGYDVTVAELSQEEKDSISHRGKALRALAPFVAAGLGQQVTRIIHD